MRRAHPHDLDLALQVRVIDPVVQAPALQRVVQFARPVRRDDDRRGRLGRDTPDLGDRHGELREHLQQERFELVVRAVELVHQEHRARARADRCEQRTLHQEVRPEQILRRVSRRPRRPWPARRSAGAIVPFVERLRGVDPLVALEPDQPAPQEGTRAPWLPPSCRRPPRPPAGAACRATTTGGST